MLKRCIRVHEGKKWLSKLNIKATPKYSERKGKQKN